MAPFQNDLLESVRQMKAGQAVPVTEAPVSLIVATRDAIGLSQARFAALLGVSVRTRQE